MSCCKQADAALAQVTADDFPADYDALSMLLDVATERLGRAWGAVGHLNGVADTPELRAAYNENLPRITEFYTRLGADERLYAKYKAVMASPAAASLNPARQRALSNALRDFVLSGAELQGSAKRVLPSCRNCRPTWSRSSPSTCSTPPTGTPTTPPGRAGRCAGGRAAGHPGCGRGRRQGRPQADPAFPGLLPGHAVRHRPQPCAKPCTAPTSPAPASSARPSATTAR